MWKVDTMITRAGAITIKITGLFPRQKSKFPILHSMVLYEIY